LIRQEISPLSVSNACLQTPSKAIYTTGKGPENKRFKIAGKIFLAFFIQNETACNIKEPTQYDF